MPIKLDEVLRFVEERGVSGPSLEKRELINLLELAVEKLSDSLTYLSINRSKLNLDFDTVVQKLRHVKTEIKSIKNIVHSESIANDDDAELEKVQELFAKLGCNFIAVKKS